MREQLRQRSSAKDWPPLTGETKLIGYGDTFRISETIIKPQQTISTDEPFPHLVVLVTDMIFPNRMSADPQGVSLTKVKMCIRDSP